MTSMSGADDNLNTEFKKSIEISIVQKIRTVKDINAYVLFLSICLWTIFSKCLEQAVACARNMASMSREDCNRYKELLLWTFLGGEVMNYCFKNSGASGDTKRHAGNMASMSGVKDNLLHGIQIWDWDIQQIKAVW